MERIFGVGGRLVWLGATVTLVAALAVPAQAAAQSRMDIVVAATTDVHGRLRAWDYTAGRADPAHSLAAAATVVDSIRGANSNRTVLVDAGDLLQGNPLTLVAARVAPTPVHPVIASMNVMRYDAAVLGNHEFNYGVPFLRAAISRSAFPFLAANVLQSSGKALGPAFTIVERSGARIGIVGATTPGSMVWDRDNLRDAGITVGDIVPAVRRGVSDARRAGAEVIVVLLHSGLDEPTSYDTVTTGLPSENVAARVAREVNGIDVIVLGHSHREVVDSTINGALLVQPRNWAGSVGVATVSLERSRGRWRVTSHRGRSVSVAGHRESPEVLSASSSSHAAAMAWSAGTIGTTSAAWRSDSARVADVAIVDFVAEVMRREAGADLAAVSGFDLSASFGPGPITRAQLARLYPYDNTLRAVRISGDRLRAYLEASTGYYRTMDRDRQVPATGMIDQSVPGYNFDVVSGVQYTIDLTRPIGQRIAGLIYRGRAVVSTDTFTLALNNYRQTGGGGFAMLAGLPVTYTKDADIRGLLIAEVERVGTLDPRQYAVRNWTMEPAQAVAAAYAEQGGRDAGAVNRLSGTPPGASPPGVGSPNGLVRSAATTSPRASVTGATSPAHSAGAVRTVRVIAISDFHAALQARADSRGVPMGGAVALSAAIRRAEGECRDACVSVVVHAGDYFTGSPASDWTAGKPTVAVMNLMNIAASALGNHEFDFGQDTLRSRLRELTPGTFGANVRGRDGAVPGWLGTDTVVIRGGVRIGIVGTAGTHTPGSTKRRNLAGLTFLDPAPVMSQRVRALRAAGAQVVVTVIHDGGRCADGSSTDCHGGGLDVARAMTERPDAFIMGHSHSNLDLRIGTMPAIEPTSSARAIAIVDLSLDGAPARTELRPVYGDSTTGADPRVAAIVRTAVAAVASRLGQPVATIAERMTRRGDQYALGNLVADAVRAAGKGDVAAWNNGGIRADLPAGALLYGGVHEIAPFGNALVRVRLRGRDLRRNAEAWVSGGRPDVHVSGLTLEFDARRPQGERVVRMTFDGGVPIDDDRIYSLIINDFMLDDGDGLAPPNTVTRETLRTLDIDAISDYLRRHAQPVRGSSIARIRAVGTDGVR